MSDFNQPMDPTPTPHSEDIVGRLNDVEFDRTWNDMRVSLSAENAVAIRDLIVQLRSENERLREGLKYVRRFVRPGDVDTSYLDALLSETDR